MRANPRTRIRPAAHTHAHIHIYTHVRTYSRTRRKFSDNKSALQHCQTEFHHHSNSIHFYYSIAVQSVQTVVICHLSDIHYHPLAIVSQLSANYPPLISYSYQFIITPTHHLTHIIFHLYLISNSTHHPINMSVCYKTLLILYIFAAFSSAFSYTTVFSSFISLTDSL